MALQKAPISVPLGGGLRTDVDPKLLPLGNVLELENARQTRAGEIVKRFGGVALSNAVNSAVVPTLTAVPWQLANYRNDLIRLARVGGAQAISRWSPTLSRWAYANWGSFSNLQPSIQTALRGTWGTAVQPVSRSAASDDGMSDVEAVSGYLFVATKSGLVGGTITLTVLDQATSEVIWAYTVTGGNNWMPRLAVTTNGYLVLAWINLTTATVDALSVDPTTLQNTSPSAVQTLSVGATTNALPWFDVIADGTTVAMAWRSAANTLLGAQFTPSSGGHVNYQILTSGGAAINPKDAIAFVRNPVGYANLGILTANDAAVGVQINAGFRGTGASTVTHILDAVFPPSAYRKLTGVFTTASATAEVNAVYSRTAAGIIGGGWISRFAEFTAGATFSGLFANDVRITSKIFKYGTDHYVMGLTQRASSVSFTEPGTGVLMRVQTNMYSAAPAGGVAPAPLTRIMPGSCDRRGEGLASVVVVGSTYFTALERFTRFSAVAGGSIPLVTSYYATNLVTLTPDAILGAAVEAADALYVPGGQLGIFDGLTYADDGFYTSPSYVGASGLLGGTMVPGQKFRYAQCVAYTDKNGRTCRSGLSDIPLNPIEVLPGDTKITITGRYYGLTQRQDGSQVSVTIETYRTGNIAGGASKDAFYLLHVQANDPSLDEYAFDDLGTAAIETGEKIYTDGGVLENEVTPGFAAVAVYQNRLWGLSMDFGGSDLWYTDEFADGQGPRWSEERVVRVDDAHGPGTALAVLDDKLVIWKRDAIYAVTGQGPDPLGNGGSYFAQLVARGVGTTNPRSIAVGPDGAFFQATAARAGIRMLNRGLSVDDQIGAPVQQYAEDVTAAIVVPPQSQLRFYTASGRTLVYDFVGGIWSTYIGQPAVAAACWNGSVAAYARPATADVVTEDPSGLTYTEAGAAIAMTVTTPWLQLAGLNGYERWYRVQGVGETAGAHTLFIRCFKDFDDATPFTTQTVQPGPRWDWETRYSSKISAIKVSLREQSATAGPKMTALAMVLGVKQGLKRLPSINRTAPT